MTSLVFPWESIKSIKRPIKSRFYSIHYLSTSNPIIALIRPLPVLLMAFNTLILFRKFYNIQVLKKIDCSDGNVYYGYTNNHLFWFHQMPSTTAIVKTINFSKTSIKLQQIYLLMTVKRPLTLYGNEFLKHLQSYHIV